MKKTIIFSALIALTLFSGCAGIKLFPDWPSVPEKASKQSYNEREYLHVIPAQVCQKCGSPLPQPEIVKEYTRNLDATTPPLTLFSRIKAAFGLLGFWGVLLLVISIVIFGPGPLLLFLWKRKEAWKKGLTETVVAIKQAKIVDGNPDLHNALLEKQSPRTQVMVNKIRAQATNGLVK